MIDFDTDYIDRLNRLSTKGKFLKTVILTETIAPLVKRYFVDHEESIVFEGNTYIPLRLFFDSVKTSGAMPTEGCDVALSNVGNTVVKYLRDIDVTGNEVIIQLIHFDLLSTLTNYWRRRLRVLKIRADSNAAVFLLGRDLGKNKLPRGVLTSDEAPGLNSSVPRF